MGAIGGDELSRWKKTQENGGDSGGGGGARGREEKILVSVRLRPPNEKELANKDPCDWECINDTTIIFRNSLPERSMFPIAYSYDRVFSCDTNTRQVYEEGAKDVALSVVGGINSSIFAYGQTSSGKTYTMYGITEYSVADIYDYIQRHQERAFVMKFSAIEIYNEAVKDLLSNDPTPIRLLDDPEKGTVVEKLTEETLRDSDHLKELLAVCEAQRQVGETSLNETSSRSHQILRLTIESSAREFLGKDNSSTLAASVSFVDLAGSERASQAMSAGARLKEGCHINRSLLTLGTVIRKLSKGKNGHIPYRDSKLTRILQPSLGGNARTAIICTMSPARSHIEQSRNTLLFATCAKEVVNSAHVNLVMSDKALVKHLQKELARLESELKYPGPPSNVSLTEALLKEKDAQIRKMEKEIKELVQQRDLAQSRLENLLQSVGDDQVAGHWDSNQLPRFLANTFEDDNSVSGASPTTYRDPDFHATKFTPPDFANDSEISSEHEYQNFEKPNEEEITSERLSTSSQNFGRLLQQHGEQDVTSCGPEVEDLCKEVRCIEMDETSRSRSETLLAKGDDLVPPSEELRNGGNPSFRAPGESVCTLEQQLQNAKRAADRIEKQHHGELEQSLWPLEKDVCNSRSSVLARSSSCRPTISHNSPSPWFVDENCENTPPSRSLREFAGRPGGPSRRIMSLNFTAESARNSGEGSQSSESRVSTEVTGRKRAKTTSDEDIASIGEFVAGMKEMAQIQFHKHADDGKETEGRDNGHSADQQLVKDVSIDPMLNPVESPSRWPFEFGQQQQEVIILWHECYVSLVHRTYFFLLFKGDPADSFYMEVELRRLSFLRRMFVAGNAHKSMVNDPETPASSIKALRREREMLSRRMQKKLTSEERDALYLEWGIPLDSKQRRLQLARLLWSDTKNMDRIKESASIVAKLVGLLEPGQELKEMFGLSFTPQKSNRRSYNWKI